MAALLTSTLGEEKSDEVVRAAMDQLDLPPDHALEQRHVDAILDLLSRAQGIVGLAARFAKQRARFSALTLPPPAPSTPEPVTPRAPHAAPPSAPSAPADEGKRRVDPRVLIDLFVSTLGEEKSAETVRAAMRHQGFDEAELTRDQALSVLEALATVPGIVGVTARFAKARVILKFA